MRDFWSWFFSIVIITATGLVFIFFRDSKTNAHEPAQIVTATHGYTVRKFDDGRVTCYTMGSSISCVVVPK